jgi:hypothetical protein
MYLNRVDELIDVVHIFSQKGVCKKGKSKILLVGEYLSLLNKENINVQMQPDPAATEVGTLPPKTHGGAEWFTLYQG